MTNLTNLNLNITSTEIAQETFYAIPSSIEKASMIDYPAYLIFAPKNAVYNSAMAGISYDIRTTINKAGKQALNIAEDDTSTKIMLATVSGGAGGAFKYAAIGQNPLVGAISTTGYEICNAFKFCADNPLVYGPVTIGIESLDAAAQTYLKILQGDTPGAVSQAAVGTVKIGEAVYKSAIEGATVGATVYGLIQSLYIPVIETAPKVLNFASDYFNNLLSNTLIGVDDYHEL